MPFLSAHHFIAARGLDEFIELLELCHQHRPIAEIGRRFSFSPSMAARYRKRFFVVEYHLREAVVEAIEFHLAHTDDRQSERAKRLRSLYTSPTDASTPSAGGPVLLR